MTPDETLWAGDMPAAYDRLLGPVLFAPFAEILAKQAAHTGATRVLELAAGTGVLTSRLVELLPDAAIRATDLNPAMVEYGSGRVPGADWIRADAHSIPFESDRFDLVICGFGVMFFADRTAAFNEVRRVLRSRGRFLFSTWDEVGTCAFPLALDHAITSVFGEDSPDFITRIPHGYSDPDAVRNDLVATGFNPVEAERKTLVARASSARKLAEGFCLGSPLRFELEQRGDLPDLTAAVAEKMTAELGTGPVTGELAAFLVEASNR